MDTRHITASCHCKRLILSFTGRAADLMPFIGTMVESQTYPEDNDE